eukprot:TRINITY_DN2012_c0_g1_i5.p1 TRINITY_DN2012_c0_g1~~TRINITY_DN2012_c0_g1_i5.p1  ORF type:complete len:350 (-),score=72.03 TRINITY_DN2012_c0_g1_i5:307-1356(-)
MLALGILICTSVLSLGVFLVWTNTVSQETQCSARVDQARLALSDCQLAKRRFREDHDSLVAALEAEAKSLRQRLSELQNSYDQLARQNGLPPRAAEPQPSERPTVRPATPQNEVEEPKLAHNQEEIIPVIVFAHDRAQYLSRALASLIKHRPDVSKFPIFVSQDTHSAEVDSVLRSFRDVTHLHYVSTSQPVAQNGENVLYYHIANHYRWGLSQIFDSFGFNSTIILEEDIEIAPDFFSYFVAHLPVLRGDPSLFCVSAWSDNGYPNYVFDPKIVYRSDFFPGLGWMMDRSLWNELGGKWARAYWDDWLREPAQRRGRACLRPEISRTANSGQTGVSQDNFLTRSSAFS